MRDIVDFDSLHHIFPGRHFYQFYKTVEDFLLVMVPFFRQGLEKGEACLWLVSKRNGAEAARQSALILIPKCAEYMESGQFHILPAEDWYLTEGAFDEERAIQNAGRYWVQIQNLGFHTLRAAGDIGGAIHRSQWPLVEAYEKKISPWIASEGVIALCAYPILECTPTQTRGVVGCHEDVLVGRF